ncbi:hypothetical protein J7F03_14520 [Streptomyces sp. ISL-43]|uniref:hypothetical protein n=1 Tax=Streptomyces sp. ISL-43 TaxID=2819183 RepID=UPI001BE99997|nr:hypothetical protein [Streptomyces sp. ISL-43]MBT2448271.1 hypothetical protein [Streptomyces sp. ISL-43]
MPEHTHTQLTGSSSNPSPALAARLAELFPRGVVDVQRGGGHLPWLDGEAWFAARVERFLATGA